MIRIGTCGWSYDHWQPELYAPGLPAARPAGPLRGCLPHRRVARKCRGYLMARLGCFSLRVAVRGRATCRALGIDVRHTAARQAVSQHDAVTTDQELTDAGLVVACAGFDD